MGKIFNDLSYGRYVNQYAGLPLDELEKTGDVLDTQYRDNIDAQDKLEILISNLEVRDQNQPHVQEALARANKKLEETRERGNWEHAGFQVRGAAKEFAMDKAIQGSLKDKKAYDAYMADLDERFKKGEAEGGLSPDRYKAAKAKAIKDNQAKVEFNATTGEYDGIFSAYSPMNYVDIQDAMFEKGKEWKASGGPVEVTYVDEKGKKTTSRVKWDPFAKGYLIGDTEKKLSESELQTGLRNAVLANPMYRGYIEEGLMFHNDAKFTNADGEKIPVEMKDVFGDKGLLNLSEVEADKLLVEMDYDPEKVKADPELMEALYNNIYMQKKVEGYVNPAASAYSFSDIKSKWFTDLIMQAALEDANEKKKQNYKAAHKRDALRLKQIEEANPTAIAPTTVTSSGDEYDNSALRKSVTFTKNKISKIKGRIKKHEAGKGKGNIATLNNELKTAEWTLRVQEGDLNANLKGYSKSVGGKRWKNNAYKDWIAEHPSGTDGFLSQEEFNTAIENGGVEEPTITRTSGYVQGRHGQEKQMETVLTPEGKRGRFLNNLHAELNANINDYVRRKPPGRVANFLKGSGTGQQMNTMAKYNKLKTDLVNNNRGNYLVSGGVQLTDWINTLVVNNDNKAVNLEVSMTDGDENGEYPDYVTITDKATGKTIAQEKLYGEVSNADNRRLAGEGLMRESQPGTQQYQTGQYMAASASFPAMKNDDLHGQLASVSDNDLAGRSVDSEPFAAGQGSTGQPLMWQVVKARQNYYDDSGFTIGTNTVYRLKQIDSNGYKVGMLTTDGKKETYDNNFFRSLDDIKVALYTQLKPKVEPQYTVTGISSSTSNYSSNPANDDASGGSSDGSTK